MSRDLTLQVFENAYASTTLGVNKTKGQLLYQPDPGQISGLTFGTKLPGGFVECSFVFTGTQIDALRWKFQFTSEHLDILHAGQAVYYGIIEDMDLDRVNATVAVTARGYYITLEDQRYDTTSTTSELFRQAVYWLLSQQGASKSWRGYFLDDNLTLVTDTGTTVQRRIGTSGLETPREALEMWAALGDASGHRYWPAVWDSRLVEVSQEQTETKWFVRLDQLATATLSGSRSEIWNSVIVSYQDVADNLRKLTTAVEDTASKERHGIRQLLVPAGELSATAAAQLGASVLAKTKDLRDRSALVLHGSVFDSGMCERALWNVRAGDIIEAVDLQIPGRSVGEVVLGLNKWMIRETHYDADADTLSISPDQDEATIQDVIAQAVEATRILTRGVAAAGGSGTVTSVAQTVPAEFSIAGSPVTTAGTLAISKVSQTANTIWAGPTTGAAAAPAFRAMVAADVAAHATSHKNGGADEVGTATPTANAIPKADSSGLLDGWVTNVPDSTYYRGGNLHMNWPVMTGQTTLPEWWDDATHITTAVTTCTAAGITKAVDERIFSHITDGSGSGVAAYQRITLADHQGLAVTNAISASRWVYQAGANTITLTLKDSTGVTMGTATTTASATWTLLKVQNKTPTAGSTYVDVQLSVNQNSVTIYSTAPMCHVGTAVKPYEENPLLWVHVFDDTLSGNDPANTNWNTQSFATPTHPLACLLQLTGRTIGTGAGQHLNLRPTYSTQAQSAATKLQAVQVSGVNTYASKLVNCNDTQNVDWSVSNANVSGVDLAVAGYWRFAN